MSCNDESDIWKEIFGNVDRAIDGGSHFISGLSHHQTLNSTMDGDVFTTADLDRLEIRLEQVPTTAGHDNQTYRDVSVDDGPKLNAFWNEILEKCREHFPNTAVDALIDCAHGGMLSYAADSELPTIGADIVSWFSHQQEVANAARSDSLVSDTIMTDGPNEEARDLWQNSIHEKMARQENMDTIPREAMAEHEQYESTISVSTINAHSPALLSIATDFSCSENAERHRSNAPELVPHASPSVDPFAMVHPEPDSGERSWLTHLQEPINDSDMLDLARNPQQHPEYRQATIDNNVLDSSLNWSLKVQDSVAPLSSVASEPHVEPCRYEHSYPPNQALPQIMPYHTAGPLSPRCSDLANTAPSCQDITWEAVIAQAEQHDGLGLPQSNFQLAFHSSAQMHELYPYSQYLQVLNGTGNMAPAFNFYSTLSGPGSTAAAIEEARMEPDDAGSDPRRQLVRATTYLPSQPAQQRLYTLGFDDNGRCLAPSCESTCSKTALTERDDHTRRHLPVCHRCTICMNMFAELRSLRAHIISIHPVEALQLCLSHFPKPEERAALIEKTKLRLTGTVDKQGRHAADFVEEFILRALIVQGYAGENLGDPEALVDRYLSQGHAGSFNRKQFAENSGMVDDGSLGNGTTKGGRYSSLSKQNSRPNNIFCRMQRLGLMEIVRPWFWPYQAFHRADDNNELTTDVVSVATLTEVAEGLSKEMALDRYLRKTAPARK